MRGRYTRAGSASLHLFKGRWGWLDVSIEGRTWLNVAYLQLEVRDRRARAGSVAPLHPLKRQRDSFAARLDVSIEGRACWFAFDELDVACLQNWRCVTVVRERGASLPCIPTRSGEVLLLRGWAFLLRVAHSVPMERLGRAGRCLFAESEVCSHRARAGSVAPLHPLKGWRGSFAARLGVFLKVEHSVPMERLGRAGCRLFAESEVCGHRARAGSVAPLHPHEGRRGSFAARLDVFLKVERSVPMERLGRAGYCLFAESEVCGHRARAGSVAPLHPLKGWQGSFAVLLGVFLKVERSVPMERLGRAGCRLFAESEVCGHRARAGSVVPLHPLKRQRDSFAARLDVSIEGRACWFAFDELDVARLRNRRCATIA